MTKGEDVGAEQAPHRLLLLVLYRECVLFTCPLPSLTCGVARTVHAHQAADW